MAKTSLVLLLVLFAAAPWSAAGYMSKFKAATACAAGNSGTGCENNPQIKAAMIAKAAVNFDDWVEDDEGVNLIQKKATVTKGRKRATDVDGAAVPHETSTKDELA
eukprot:gnl/TRDRNA2_/TRDRNA2_178202_c0_seq1.p1 gnl/TRDRNA2_/TRDRNA2_178202_c0~~gnl/TRDRNA2_/TRDRNA2_178202_c0_seq1.p1  ORF type:complete len:106 (+),score=37.93 gnl/TRDRNA2_/TRDRNA2_178202_c0_seq1:103-420(+)